MSTNNTSPHRSKTQSNRPFQPKEKDICKIFYKRVWLMQQYNQFSGPFLLFHIANEQNNNAGYTKELMRMGLIAGVPDYCILLPGGKVAFIEFKRNEKCKLTIKQEKFKEYCTIFSIPHLVAKGLTVDEAIDLAIDWIKSLLNKNQ